MAFSNLNISKAIAKGQIKIKPLKNDQIGGASIDLTLSNEWYFFKPELRKGTVDLSKTDFKRALNRVKAESIELAPGEMCLGKTLEKITLADNIIGELEGRSRYARMGLSVHITSSLVQPGSDNHQILEIVNFAPFTIRLHAGMRISQILFDRLEAKTTKPYRKFGKIAKKQ